MPTKKKIQRAIDILEDADSFVEAVDEESLGSIAIALGRVETAVKVALDLLKEEQA